VSGCCRGPPASGPGKASRQRYTTGKLRLHDNDADDHHDLKPIVLHGASSSGHRPAPSRRDGAPCGTPDMGAADAVKGDVYTLAREEVNFFHEVLMLVINWDTARSETADAPRDERVPFSRPASRPSCKSAEPTPPAAP
jgi:hypothetical protein